jgi:hypothetical protein
VDVSDIVNNVHCEIRKTLIDNIKTTYWFLGWGASISLDLDIKRKAGGTGEITFNFPLVPEGLGITVGGGPTKDTNNNSKLTYQVLFKDFVKDEAFDCGDSRTNTIMTGKTGVGDWLLRVAESTAPYKETKYPTAPIPKFCPASIGTSIEFIVTLDGNGSITIKDIQAGDGTIAISPKTSGKYIENHKLTIAAQALPQDEKSIKGTKKIIGLANEEIKKLTPLNVDLETMLSAMPKCTPYGYLIEQAEAQKQKMHAQGLLPSTTGVRVFIPPSELTPTISQELRAGEAQELLRDILREGTEK